MIDINAEAKRRIDENKQNKSEILDLSGLGLTELPEELWDCVWVEELGLGYRYYWNEEQQNWVSGSSSGKMANRLTVLPNTFSNFINLTKLLLDNNKLSDINVLSSLVNLTYLDLKDTAISDISALSSLVNLTELDLRGTFINDISALSSLLNLTILDLNGPQLNNIKALSSLVNLTHLNLIHIRIDDISALNGLVNLTHLYLEKTPISDISALTSLVHLTNLSSDSSQLSDISVLGNLVNLTNLDLIKAAISDISVLGNLMNLTNLDLSKTSITDISILSSLVNLTRLYLSKTPIFDISALNSLANLTTLDLSQTAVREITPLSSLTRLTNLDLSDNFIPHFPFELLSLPKLQNLNLQNTYCQNLPPELTYEFNALPLLKDYYTDLLKDPYTSYDAKQLIVGNGRVGKTSLLKALYGLGDFDPNEDSTHGIQLFDTTLPLPEKQATAHLNLWDFGGQELYHATHRVFMKTRALYLVVWDSDTEDNPGEETIQLHGQDYPFRNYSLSYWLGNVRALSKDAKIIVICNKADDGKERFPKDIHELQTQYNIDSFISISAKTGYGIFTLRQRIQYLLDQMPEMGMQMPGSWRSVREKLTDLRSSRQYISMEEYQIICESEVLSEDSMDTLLYFLHQSGFLFWHEQYLKHQIILDQKWALQAIYELLDRKGLYPILKGNALRHRSVLAECWRDYSAEQVDLFLEMMQSCELALKLENKQSDNPRYLIPEFLPDTPAPAVADIWEATTGPIFHFRFQHPFFHAALIQRFIVRSAKLAERYDLLWRTGLLLKVDNTMTWVQAYPEAGRIDMQLRGSNPANLLERLKNEITAIQEVYEEASFLLSLTGQPDEWVTLEQLQLQISKGKTQVASITGEILELAPFRLLIHTPSREKEDEAPMDLKNLADQKSGAQLLPSINLADFKSTAKSKFKEGIEMAIAYLFEHFHPNSSSHDELILLQGQWSSFSRSNRIGTLSHDNSQRFENQIRAQIMLLINTLTEQDIKP